MAQLIQRLFLAVGLIAGPAIATPPLVVNATYEPLCVSGDRLAVLARASSNQGSHYIVATTLALVLFDAVTGEVRIDHQGGLTSVDDFDEDREVSWKIAGAGGLVAKLRECGTSRCSNLDQRRFSMHQFIYQLSPGLVVSLGGRRRSLTNGFSLEPSWAIADHGSDEPEPLLVQPLSEFSESWAESVSSQNLEAEIELATRTLFLFQVEEMGNIGLFVSLPTHELNRQKSWLINAHGMDLHRQRKWNESADWFEHAAILDPTNPTPRFNLACAHARAGRPERAVDELRKLPATRELRTKISKDADFGGIRRVEVFTKFLETLSE